MSYRIKRLRVKNFKCFDAQKYYSFEFDSNLNPVILSGPNGFGKTTFFDAIELIFTQNITRLHKDIEDKRINLGKNILLNEADRDGILVLDLNDEINNSLTILTVIDHHNEKLTIGSSIKYITLNEVLYYDDDIENILSNDPKWKPSLEDCVQLKYSLDHFNVYYYVSQAESVHFLRKQISERKTSVNALLNTDMIDGFIDDIEKKLIGGHKTKKGVLINDAIGSSKDIIDAKATQIKTRIKEVELDLNSSEYEQLLVYAENTSPFVWDSKEVDFDKENIEKSLNEMIREIEALHHFAINKNDYNIFLENEKIRKLLNNKVGINDFITYSKFVDNQVVNRDKIRNLIAISKQKVEVYNCSSFFREKLDISIFKKEDLMRIKEIDSSLLLCDVDEIANIIEQIKKIQTELSSNQKLLNNLDKARNELHRHIDALDNARICPYCSHQFQNADELEQAFSNLTQSISERKTGDSEKVGLLLEKLHVELDADYQKILSYIQGLDELKVKNLNLTATEYKQFVADLQRGMIVEIISSYYTLDDAWFALDRNGKSLALERFLQEKVGSYNVPEFESIYEKYEFQNIAKNYESIFSIPQGKLLDKDNIDKKIKYLKYKKSFLASIEITQLKEELKIEIIKKHKLEHLRAKLEELRTQYKEAIDSYRNQVIKKLRVPLLIYSGKILQDYQNGLGVFISRDEMRFVSNGDAKHDILNTFSSGQISGFVLSFLFAMNKQYITKSNDDIAFILVDDPVQTMDDINIASLIEVLRNDFAEKQLILSTHETDKENYILYKFLKYNLKGQSFNVKEKLYL